ncbi:phage protein Gp36 family protein [Aureliella helgolandensis]|uniref:Uncharacterized protein n=1 Tax=Aureliella helgolandensis TaxID=2527968 RepID=A0A518GCN5_9BACT|nr:phage protein Gp36 family protein [Aureliella helgolandensis]QDV26348.1 hypothetical protein Q31a_47210 [Aureliella helgolandensis]
MPDPLVPYATGDDLIKRYDIDLIGDLCQDTREELDWHSDITELTEHVNVVSALEDASGEIDVSMQAGGRYTPEQLMLLITPVEAVDTNNSKKHLIRITCAIAMSILVERRLERVSMETADWLRKAAKAFLDQLRRGENVFGIPAAVDAGTIHIDTVSSVHIENLNLLPGRMSNYFPGTAQRTPRVN